MQEVTLRLRFNRECLGFAKKTTRKNGQVIYCMPKDAEGRVMFLPSWWKDRFDYAAKVISRYQELAKRIAWDPVIDGRLYTWKRVVVRKQDDPRGRERYALHEAFRPGDVIGVNAVLPDGMTVDAFQVLLEVIGKYRGISPFQGDAAGSYGTFDVVSVCPAIRSAGHVPLEPAMKD